MGEDLILDLDASRDRIEALIGGRKLGSLLREKFGKTCQISDERALDASGRLPSPPRSMTWSFACYEPAKDSQPLDQQREDVQLNLLSDRV